MCRRESAVLCAALSANPSFHLTGVSEPWLTLQADSRDSLVGGLDSKVCPVRSFLPPIDEALLPRNPPNLKRPNP